MSREVSIRKTDRGYRKRLDKELLQLYDIEKANHTFVGDWRETHGGADAIAGYGAGNYEGYLVERQNTFYLGGEGESGGTTSLECFCFADLAEPLD